MTSQSNEMSDKLQDALKEAKEKEMKESIVKANIDFNKRLQEGKNDEYDIHVFPQNDTTSVDDKLGFKLFGDEPKFSENALPRLFQFLNHKDQEIVVKGVRMKCTVTSSDPTWRSKPMIMKVFSEHLGEKRVSLKFNLGTKKSAKSLQIQRSNGGMFAHVQLVLEAIKYLIDGILEDDISEKQWDSFIKSKPESNMCVKCGKIFSTKQGPKRHTCDNNLSITDLAQKKRGRGNFDCDKCNLTFSTSNELIGHNIHGCKPTKKRSKRQNSPEPSKDSSLKLIACTKCDNTYETEIELRHHIDECLMDVDNSQSKLISTVTNTPLSVPLTGASTASVTASTSTAPSTGASSVLVTVSPEADTLLTATSGLAAISSVTTVTSSVTTVTSSSVTSDVSQSSFLQQKLVTEDTIRAALPLATSLVSSRNGASRPSAIGALMEPPMTSDLYSQTVDSFVELKYPNYGIINVKGDGACLPRSMSVCLFGTESYWSTISRVFNKLKEESICNLRPYMKYPIKVEIGQGDIIHHFDDESQYLQFLKSEGSQKMWRDENDLAILASFLNIDIFVLSVRNNCMISLKPVVFFANNNMSKSKSSVKPVNSSLIIINDNNAHFRAVVDKNTPVYRNEALLTEFAKLISKDDKTVETRVTNLEANVSGKSKTSPTSSDNYAELASVVKLQGQQLQQQGQQIQKLQEENNHLRTSLSQAQKQISNLQDGLVIQSQTMSNMKQLLENLQLDSETAMDTDDGKEDEIIQLNQLHMQKNSGFIRTTPVSSPTRKPKRKCNICSVDFDTESNFNKHVASCKSLLPQNGSAAVKSNPPLPQNSKDVLDSSNSKSKSDTNNHSRTNRLANLKKVRNWNCIDCSFQGENARELETHCTRSGHSSNTQQCYICDKTCNNWRELMVHRKEDHFNQINSCRNYASNQCRFSDRSCWYKHEMQNNNKTIVSNSENVDFTKPAQGAPPDHGQMLSQICNMLQQLLTTKSSIQSQEKEISKI